MGGRLSLCPSHHRRPLGQHRCPFTAVDLGQINLDTGSPTHLSNQSDENLLSSLLCYYKIYTTTTLQRLELQVPSYCHSNDLVVMQTKANLSIKINNLGLVLW